MKNLALILVILAGVWVQLARAGGRNNSALDAAEVNARLAAAYLEGQSVVNMSLSRDGLDRIAGREGFSATRYKDADGWSIGYGHFIQVGDVISEPISRVEATELLIADAQIAERAVKAYVKVPLSQAQFDALVSLVYNIGANAFKNSTLLKRLNLGDYSGAVQQITVWNRSQGAVLPVLVARRADEVKQFLA